MKTLIFIGLVCVLGAQATMTKTDWCDLCGYANTAFGAFDNNEAQALVIKAGDYGCTKPAVLAVIQDLINKYLSTSQTIDTATCQSLLNQFGPLLFTYFREYHQSGRLCQLAGCSA